MHLVQMVVLEVHLEAVGKVVKVVPFWLLMEVIPMEIWNTKMVRVDKMVKRTELAVAVVDVRLPVEEHTELAEMDLPE